MSNSDQTSTFLPITNNVDDNIKPYTPRAQALDCLKFLLYLGFLLFLLGLVPAVTRFLIFLQPGCPSFNVENSTFAVLNVSSNSITADLDVILLVKNPDGKNMIFDDIKAVAVRGGDEEGALANVTIAAFEVDGKAQTKIEGRFRGMNLVAVENCSMSKGCGGVNMTVQVAVEARYGGWTWPTRRDKVSVVCEDVIKGEVPLNTTTKMISGPSGCGVSGRWTRLVSKCTNIFWNYIYLIAIFIGILIFSLE